jgi:hypothetical protein
VRPKAIRPLGFLCPTCRAVYSGGQSTFQMRPFGKLPRTSAPASEAVVVTTKCPRHNCGAPATTIVLTQEGWADAEILEDLQNTTQNLAECGGGHPLQWTEEASFESAIGRIAGLFQTRSIDYRAGGF